MKIVIIGPWSLPWQIKIEDYFSPDEKIFYTVQHPHPWIYNLALGLANIPNNEVHVITLNGLIKKDRLIIYDNVYFHILKVRYKKIQALFYFSPLWNNINKLLHRINPDIIHGQSRGVESYIALKSNFPAVITNHGQIKEEFRRSYPILKPFRYYSNKIYEILVNNNLKYGIGVSPSCVNNLYKYINADNVYYIENPINLIYYNNDENCYNNDLIFIGGIIPRKRVFELIKIIKKIPNVNLKIVSSGGDVKYINNIKKYINVNNLNNRIKFLGYNDPNNIVRLLKHSFALCLPSFYESFGVVICEALASGVPVIATKVGGPPSIIKNGEVGYLIDPDDNIELEEKIKLLLNDKTLVKKMGEKAKKISISRWHPNLIAQKTMNVYYNVINKERY